jgi:hypothetical protein
MRFAIGLVLALLETRGVGFFYRTQQCDDRDGLINAAEFFATTPGFLRVTPRGQCPRKR